MCMCIYISVFIYVSSSLSVHPSIYASLSMSIICLSIIYYLSDLSSLSLIYLYHLIYKIPNRELSFVTIFLAYLLSFFFDSSCILSLQVYLVVNYIHLDVLAQFDHLCLEIGTFCTFTLHHNIYLGSYLPDIFLLIICFSFFSAPPTPSICSHC